MARYDTWLDEERGAVRSGMSPNRSDYWGAADYSRDYHPREMHYWRRPDELRGDVRGGSAFTYGFGRDYDTVYRGGGRPTPRYDRDFSRRGRRRARPGGRLPAYYDRELRGRFRGYR